jgi:hypothetical protein
MGFPAYGVSGLSVSLQFLQAEVMDSTFLTMYLWIYISNISCLRKENAYKINEIGSSKQVSMILNKFASLQYGTTPGGLLLQQVVTQRSDQVEILMVYIYLLDV